MYVMANRDNGFIYEDLLNLKCQASIISYKSYDTSNLKLYSASLFLVIFIAIEDESHPIHCLLILLATTRVVPEPQKKSAIRLPGFENFSIILSSSATCFSVPYPVE